MLLKGIYLNNHDHFTVLWTGDGSPSLRGATEPMHHLGGAYSETQYIYGEALRHLVNEGSDSSEWRVLVVGLGLGYIELLAMAEALKNNRTLFLLTYEIEQGLVDLFLSWLKDETQSLVYDRMLDFFNPDYPNFNLKEELLRAFVERRWKIHGELNKNSLPTVKYQALMFDAFSGKSTPDLWSEEFLLEFLEKTSDPSFCVFSTYACTGVLKRTLNSLGFQVQKRVGFQGKRHSTLGIKRGKE